MFECNAKTLKGQIFMHVALAFANECGDLLPTKLLTPYLAL